MAKSLNQCATYIKNLSFLAKRNWLEYAASSKITLRLKEAFAPVTTAFAKNLESLRKTQKIIKKYGEKIAQKTYRLIQKNPKIVDVEKGIVSSIKKTAKELSKEKGAVGRVTEKVTKDIGKSKKISRPSALRSKSKIRLLRSSSDKLPNQGLVSAEKIPGAPLVDAGKQGKHIVGHNNCNPEKSLWPAGENGVELTQEAWVKGKLTRKSDKTVKKYTKGDLKIKVHIDENGYIHGYPDYPQK